VDVVGRDITSWRLSGVVTNMEGVPGSGSVLSVSGTAWPTSSHQHTSSAAAVEKQSDWRLHLRQSPWAVQLLLCASQPSDEQPASCFLVTEAVRRRPVSRRWWHTFHKGLSNPSISIGSRRIFYVKRGDFCRVQEHHVVCAWCWSVLRNTVGYTLLAASCGFRPDQVSSRIWQEQV
jgi:hypothetical protein